MAGRDIAVHPLRNVQASAELRNVIGGKYLRQLNEHLGSCLARLALLIEPILGRYERSERLTGD